METTIQHPEPAISKLSAEILSYIFILNVNRISRQSLKTSVNSSHVCRLWRRVILSYPELWSRMVFLDYPTEWLDELLRPSEPLLIDVEWLPSLPSGSVQIRLCLKISFVQTRAVNRETVGSNIHCISSLIHPSPKRTPT